MSDKDPEILPPAQRLPANRHAPAPQPLQEAGRIDTGGVVSSALTAWKAESQSRALNEIAKRHRSEADALKAYGEVSEAFETTARTVNKLRHLSDTLALDDERAKSERAEEQEDLKHRKEMNRRRRARELEEADTQHVEAQRQKFTAQQGYENQQRLKELNLRIWEKRREAQVLDAHVEAERIRSELRADSAPKVPQSSLESMRAKAEEALMTAFADGNDAEIERWQRVLDALGE